MATTNGKPPGLCTVASDGGSSAGVLTKKPKTTSTGKSPNPRGGRAPFEEQAEEEPTRDERMLEITLERHVTGDLSACRDDLPKEAWVEVVLAQVGHRDAEIVRLPLDGTPSTVRLTRPNPDETAWLLIQPPGGASRTALDELRPPWGGEPVLVRDPTWRLHPKASAERYADDLAAAIAKLGIQADEPTVRRLLGLGPGDGPTPWLVLRPPRMIQLSETAVRCRLELRYPSLLRASFYLEALQRTLQTATEAIRCPSGDARLHLAHTCRHWADAFRLGIDFAAVDFPSVEAFHQYRGFDELFKHATVAERYGSRVSTRDRIIYQAPRVPLHEIVLAEHEAEWRRQAEQVHAALQPLVALSADQIVTEFDALAMLSARHPRWLQPPSQTVKKHSVELETFVVATAAFEGQHQITQLVRTVAASISWIHDFEAWSRGPDVFEAADRDRAESWLAKVAGVLAGPDRTWPSPDPEVRSMMMYAAAQAATSEAIASELLQDLRIVRAASEGLAKEPNPSWELPEAEIRRIADDARRAVSRGAAAVRQRLKELGSWIDFWDSKRVSAWLAKTLDLRITERDRRFFTEIDRPSLTFLHQRNALLYHLSLEVRRHRLTIDRTLIHHVSERFALRTFRSETVGA
ncbi:MAG: hypothetical protein AAGM22_26800, partial [Acidobacteriota bacterium]